eukprot:g5911.t2
MGGDTTPQEAAAGAISVADARAVPLDGDEFVVVEQEQEQENLRQAADDLPAKGPLLVSATDSAAVGASLSTSGASSTTPSSQSSSSSTTSGPSPGDDGPGGDADSTGLPRFDAAADALIEAAGLLYKFFYAYAAVAFGFLRAHADVAYEFVHAHAVVAYEFVYAYATVATQEALALLERAWSWARSVWQRVEERSPASVKRAMRRGFVPAVVAVGLSLLLVLPAYWAIPRGGGGAGGGAHRLSAQDWQAKHDLLSSKYSAETVRQRLKYDSLAGRHMELQQEYETLLKDFKNQQRAARAARNGPKTPPETCSKGESVLGPVKDAFKVAEQSAYEYFSHFSEGLREDVREVKGLLQRKARSWLEALR